MLFVCLLLTTNTSFMNMQIDFRIRMTISLDFWLWSR